MNLISGIHVARCVSMHICNRGTRFRLARRNSRLTDSIVFFVFHRHLNGLLGAWNIDS